MRNILVSYVFLDAHGIDDQRIAFPTPHGVTVKSGLNILDSLLRLIQKNAADLCKGFFDNRDLSFTLEKLYGKVAPIIPGMPSGRHSVALFARGAPLASASRAARVLSCHSFRNCGFSGG
jgi:hypothetical protein